MATEEPMTVNERRKYLKLMKPQYEAALRKEKQRMLSDMQAITGLHRKSLLNASSLERKKRKTPRQRTYGPQVEQVILAVWESALPYKNLPFSASSISFPPILSWSLLQNRNFAHQLAPIQWG